MRTDENACIEDDSYCPGLITVLDVPECLGNRLFCIFVRNRLPRGIHLREILLPVLTTHMADSKIRALTGQGSAVETLLALAA